jgi:hypothetical protein
MARRRKVIPVILTPEQRERLERLWFYYGNYGPQTTPGNHSFIQRLLENGYDERPLRNKRTPKSEIPTPECEAAVEAVLAVAKAPDAIDEKIRNGGLRVVSSHEERPQLSPDPELKAMLDDMKRRYSVQRKRIEDMDDTPDAA